MDKKQLRAFVTYNRYMQWSYNIGGGMSTLDVGGWEY